MAQYTPGVCNIGRRQRRQRLALGAVSAGAAVAVTAWAIATNQPPTAFLGTALFAAGAALGYLQYRMEFCVSLAALARYDLSGSGGAAGTVAESRAVHTDRWRAAQIVATAVSAGGLLGVAAFVGSLALA